MADSSEYTPETIARRLDIAKQLLADGQPVKHWAQGLNELLKGYTGGNIYAGAERAEREGQAGQYAAIASILGGGAMPGGAPGGGMPGPAGPTAGVPDTGPIAPKPVPTTPAGAPTGSAYGGLPGWAPGERPLDAGPAPTAAPPSFNERFSGIPGVASALQAPPGGPVPMPPSRPPTAPAGGPTPTPSPPMPPGPMPAPTAAAAGPPPAMAPTGDLTQAQSRAKIAEMLQSPNPYVRKLGAQLGQATVAKMLTGPEFTTVAGPNGQLMQKSSTGELKAHPLAGEFAVEKLPDGTLVAVNKLDPTKNFTLPDNGRAANLAAYHGAQKKAETMGEISGKAEGNLPGTLEKANFAIATLDKLENHPGLPAGTGLTGIARRKVPGTEPYDFGVLLDQTKGQAFLDAYESLRGAGAITENEGKAATQAKARMDAAQSEGAFREGLRDYRKVLQSGIERARLMSGASKGDVKTIGAQVGPGAGAPPGAAAPKPPPGFVVQP